MQILIDISHGEERIAGLPLEELALFVLEREEAPATSEASLSFIDDARMAQLNEEFRGKTGPTDVLSFECDGLDDGFDPIPDGADDVPFELGDVIIAPDVAQRQSAAFGHSFEAEVSLLLVHGLLHLMGYDHIDDDEAEQMEARERELLGAWADAGHEAVRGVRDDTIRVRGEH